MRQRLREASRRCASATLVGWTSAVGRRCGVRRRRRRRDSAALASRVVAMRQRQCRHTLTAVARRERAQASQQQGAAVETTRTLHATCSSTRSLQARSQMQTTLAEGVRWQPVTLEAKARHRRCSPTPRRGARRPPTRRCARRSTPHPRRGTRSPSSKAPPFAAGRPLTRAAARLHRSRSWGGSARDQQGGNCIHARAVDRRRCEQRGEERHALLALGTMRSEQPWHAEARAIQGRRTTSRPCTGVQAGPK